MALGVDMVAVARHMGAVDMVTALHEEVATEADIAAVAEDPRTVLTRF